MRRSEVNWGWVAVVLAAVLVVIGPERVRTLRADAGAAMAWENALCTGWSAYQGLSKARAVSSRTPLIEAGVHGVGVDQDGLYLYDTPIGDLWMPQPGDEHSVAVVLAEQEQEVYGPAGGLGVRPGDVVIDAGAHVGLFTRTALNAGARQVITFEVTPLANASLRRNLAREIADGRVVVVEKGVWHEESLLPLAIVNRCSICNSVTHALPSTVDVPLTTIDHAVEALHLDRVDFIKLDVENAEANALRGAAQTLARFHPRLAVALENSKTPIAYGQEVLGILRTAYPGYDYECGAVTNPEPGRRVLPEILHVFPR
jgi:FkbM family methyltransferase